MNMMDNLKDALALYLIRIEDKCKAWGMGGMDSTSLLVRDRNNRDMSIWLSNDADVDPLIWHPGSQLPDPDHDAGWLLAVFQPSRRGDYQKQAYYELAAYDHVDGRWRSKIMSLRAGEVEVVKWAYLPKLANE